MHTQGDKSLKGTRFKSALYVVHVEGTILMHTEMKLFIAQSSKSALVPKEQWAKWE